MELQLSYILLSLYAIAMVILFVYSLTVLNLTINFKKFIRKSQIKEEFLEDFVPNITIQLPLYNEKYVVERLLESVTQIDYPKEKLEIQVLDDSTDESKDLTKILVESYQKEGINIQYFHRTNRQGFKAGALKEGLKKASGEFIAIFDSDFLPEKNWLKKTVPYFKNSEIGMVQTRWGHLNKDYSLLTKIQAFALDAHFTLEQVGRNCCAHFINFNGTAGLWRKQTIIEAGNWQSDTLTEDLDLSYRAQLAGWKFKYLLETTTPAELPSVLSAARSQQFRWNKGGAENLRKLSWKLIINSKVNWKTKIHGCLHLMNSSIFFVVLCLAVLSVPLLFVKNHFGHLGWYFDVLSVFFITTLIFFYCYWQTHSYLQGSSWKQFWQYSISFVQFYAVAMAFSFNNSVAVVEGLVGKKSEFVRTPKLNIITKKDNWQNNSYLSKRISSRVIIEILLFCYFVFGIISSIFYLDFSLFPLYLLASVGFFYIVYKSLTNK